MITFNDKELQVIVKGLAVLPWIEANPLMSRIARAADEQKRRDALPDPFNEPKQDHVMQANPIIVPKQLTEVTPSQEKHAKAMEPVSRKYKRALLMRILKAKGSADLSTAEIARRAGVSYVTAHKARAAFAPKKGRK